MVIKNPNYPNKSAIWIYLSTTKALLLIVAMVLAVIGTNTIGVYSSRSGVGIAAAYALTSTSTPSTTTSSSTGRTESFNIPVNITDPKLLSDCHEDIHLSGNLHIVTVTTVNSNGGSIVKVVQTDPQDIKGEGLTTGTQYHSTTGGRPGEEIASRVLTFSAGEIGGEDTTQTYVTSFNIIGSNTTGNTSSSSLPNSDHYMSLREDLDITVNSDGAITANIDNENSGCI